MSSEFALVMRGPDDTTEEDVLAQAADLLGGTVGTDEHGVRCVREPGLFVSVLASDDTDREGFRAAFGLDGTFMLTFEDLSHTDWAAMIEVQRTMMTAIPGLARYAAEGVLLEEDLNPDTVVLRFAEGAVTLNQDWDGWESAPALLEAFLPTRRIESFSSRKA